jgi:hypothetical protein
VRNYKDTCLITGGKTVYSLLPCNFAMMDAVKAEALYGTASQVSKGILYIPLYVDIPEAGTDLAVYRIVLISPQHPRVNQPMTIDTLRWMRTHQVLSLDIPNVT